jgi:hypothetical protein
VALLFYAFQLAVACWLELVTVVALNGSVAELLVVPLAAVAFVLWELVG